MYGLEFSSYILYIHILFLSTQFCTFFFSFPCVTLFIIETFSIKIPPKKVGKKRANVKHCLGLDTLRQSGVYKTAVQVKDYLCK